MTSAHSFSLALYEESYARRIQPTKRLRVVTVITSKHPAFEGSYHQFRHDKLEHLDTAVEHPAQRIPAHALLSTVVGGGCKIAIELCKRF
jgi:ubiquinone biosynthesis monooxygenase Coq7